MIRPKGSPPQGRNERTAHDRLFVFCMGYADACEVAADIFQNHKLRIKAQRVRELTTPLVLGPYR